MRKKKGETFTAKELKAMLEHPEVYDDTPIYVCIGKNKEKADCVHFQEEYFVKSRIVISKI